MNIKQTDFFLNRGLLLQLKHGEKWCDYSLQIKFLNKAEVVVIFCHNFFKLNPTFLWWVALCVWLCVWERGCVVVCVWERGCVCGCVCGVCVCGFSQMKPSDGHEVTLRAVLEMLLMYLCPHLVRLHCGNWDPDEHHTSLRRCCRAKRDTHNIQTSHLLQSFCATIFTDNRPYCEQPYIGFIRPKWHNSTRVFCNAKALGLCIWCALVTEGLLLASSVCLCKVQVTQSVIHDDVLHWCYSLTLRHVTGVEWCAGQDSLDSERSGLVLVLAQSD